MYACSNFPPTFEFDATPTNTQKQQLARVIAAGTVRAVSTRRCAACGGGADCASCNDCRGLLKTTLRAPKYAENNFKAKNQF